MKKLLTILLLIVGCEEIGLNTEQISNGTAVTDTIYVSHDTTIFVFDTVVVNHDTTISFEFDTTITFEYDTTITVYDTTITINDTIIIYEDTDCMGIVGGGAFIDDCDQCVGGTTGKVENYLQDNCGVCDDDSTNDCLQDCAGEWGGTSILSGCDNVCNSTAVADCAGVCGGSAPEDCTGLCGGSTTDCSVFDVDGNGYTAVTIGTQNWLVQNLKTTKYKDGTEISTGYSGSNWINLSTGAYAVYDNNSSNAEIYGNLYNWYAVDDNRGLCMEGWHVPSDDEWTILADYLGGSSLAGGKMKEIGTEHWLNPNTGATNESGFTALPNGMRYPIKCVSASDYYCELNEHGRYWTSSCCYGGGGAYGRELRHISATLDLGNNYKTGGFSVRCLQD